MSKETKKYINTPNGYFVFDDGVKDRSRLKDHKPKKKRDNAIKRFFKTPKGLVVTVLFVLMLIGEIPDHQFKGLMNVGIAFVTGVMIDLIVGLIQKRKKLLPDGAMVTALIVGLVMSTSSPWYQIVIVMLLALLSKHFIVIKRKPIFNPAAFGLLVSIYAFHANQSWWGGMSLLPTWCLIFLLIGGFMITKKVNKFPQVFGFLGIYFLIFVLITVYHVQGVSGVFRTPLINSALFLGFIMLTDPPTSPGKYGQQFLFGGLAALMSAACYLKFGGLSYLLLGLMVANAWKAWWLRKPEPKRTEVKMKANQQLG